ncbi:hypothetical protein GLYMA_04G055002v4 [Glycine max]|nr:hypothetical protein GLYMA_04G055002v4 [Glycine max]KAH1109926.1 hypothetical protein GYH30_009030 [Glycine max]
MTCLYGRILAFCHVLASAIDNTALENPSYIFCFQ